MWCNKKLRVSATMTNAPTILTLDCDTYSNDPQTPHHALCYLPDPKFRSKLEFLQFPQRFHGINKKDVYACEHKRLYKINSFGIRAIGTKLFRNMMFLFLEGFSLAAPHIFYFLKCPNLVKTMLWTNPFSLKRFWNWLTMLPVATMRRIPLGA